MSQVKSKKRAKKRTKVAKGSKAVSMREVPSKINIRSPFTTIARYEGAVPQAYDYDLSHIVMQTGFKDQKRSGTRLAGCCPVQLIYSDGKTSAPLVTIQGVGPASIAAINPLSIFPNNSIEQRESSNYTRFRFTTMRLIYQNQGSNTGQSASVLLGYYPDGAISSGDVSNAILFASAGSMSCPIWVPKKISDISSLLPLDDFYVDTDIGTDAGLRQSYQGAIMGNWYLQPTTPNYYGLLWLDYVLELWEPRYNGDFTLLAQKEDVKKMTVSKKLQLEKEAVRARKDHLDGPVPSPLDGPFLEKPAVADSPEQSPVLSLVRPRERKSKN